MILFFNDDISFRCSEGADDDDDDDNDEATKRVLFLETAAVGEIQVEADFLNVDVDTGIGICIGTDTLGKRV